MSATDTDFDVLRCPLDGPRLVEASAGTGKTWTLCGLYLRLLLERSLEVREILVVTFTKAATAELKLRIRARLAEALEHAEGRAVPGHDGFVARLFEQLHAAGIDPPTLRQRLDLALHSFDEAAIFTIHAFCHRALADLPLSTGLPLQTEQLDSDDEVRLQVAADFWRREIAAADLPPGLAAQLLARRWSPQVLADLLQRQLARPLARVAWPEELDSPLPAPDRRPLEAAFAAAREAWQADRARIVGIVEAALPRLHKTHYKPEALKVAIGSWDRWLGGGHPADASTEWPKLELLTKRKLKPTGKQAPVETHPFFALAEALLEARDAQTTTLAWHRLALLRAFLDRGPAALQALKYERRVTGFDDMLSRLQRCLQADDGQLARTLRQRYPAALIDEFQDTDPQQYAIFDRLYGERGAPVFLVGDPKQAIYSFRHADLHTYLNARGRVTACHTLRHNQRATGELIDALNALFGANAQAFVLDGLHYRRVDKGQKPTLPLHDASGEARAALQVWQLPARPDGAPPTKAEARQWAAQACAAEIARLLAGARRGEVRLGERALVAGDIAVLVRTHRDGGLVKAALGALGVGSVEHAQDSVFASPDAAQLQRVLAAMIEAAREPLLRAALATEALGLDAAGLAALDADPEAVPDWMARFAAHHRSWQSHGVAWMLRRWMHDEGVAARLLARGDGERRLTNLRHLAECLHEAEHDHPAPEALLRWLQQQCRSPAGGEAQQLRLESDRDLVQVLTIHRAKGLEYPVVFCPTLWDGHAGPAEHWVEGRAYHDDQGQAVVDYRMLDDDAAKSIKARQTAERRAEQMRLVYVALTRASHRCVVVAGRYLIKDSDRESRQSPLHWLVAGAGHTPGAWTKEPATADAIAAAWTALVAQTPHIGLQQPPVTPGVPLPALAVDARDLAALPAPGRTGPGWVIGSYSSLAHGAASEAAASDRDQRAPPSVEAGDHDPALADDDICAFPRGAAAGECLHALFEGIDFDDPAGWQAAIDATLRRHALADAEGRHARMLLRLLGDVLHTPLPGVGPLAAISGTRRLVEMEFHLPAHGLSTAALKGLLQRHGYEPPPLAPRTLDGYLRGFIDLVFEHEGRHYVLDWKSNHLGTQPADYAPQALARAMAVNGYHLQSLLYALALHRHLRQRIDGYRYESHFGGVLYLFVRGLRPGWRDAAGAPCGVHARRPARATLDELSQLLGRGREAA